MFKEFKSTPLLEKPCYGFDIQGSKALISCDSQLIQYDLLQHEKTAETMLESEVQRLAIHPINKSVFAIGEMRIDTYDDVRMITPSLITHVAGKVQQILYNHNGKMIAIASEENTLILCRELKISRCKPGHDGMILSAVFDPKERFVCSIGCDGCLILYQMSQTPQLLNRYTISKQVSPDTYQKLQSDFHPSGNSLWVAGKFNAQYIKTEDEPSDLEQLYQIMHKSEICIIKWVKENSVISCSLDGEIKLWHFKQFTDLSLHWQYNIQCAPLYLKFNELTLHLIDSKGNLIESVLDPPLNDYEKIYKDKDSALQDLLNRKVKKHIEEQVEVEEEQEIPVTKQEKVKQEESTAAMQDVLRPGESVVSRGRQYLCYNTVGTIISCKNTNMIEFEFFDSTFYKKFKMPNAQRYAMATLNYRGCVLASKGPNDIDDDGYVAGEGKSIIFFQQFIGDVDDFEMQLPEDEGAELLSIGNDWFAVLSDFGICRVISFCGLELYQFSTNRPIVSMCAYEHLLCLVYHDTLPILKNQQLKARIYDIYQQAMIQEFEVYTTSFATLTWIGYSDEGLLTTQDSKGYVRVYQQDRWIEVYCNKQLQLYGIYDYRLCFLRTEQVLASQKQEIVQLNFEQPFLCSFTDEKIQTNYKQYLNKLIIQQHEMYRWSEFGKYYYARNDDKQNDILVRFTQNLYDQNKLEDLQKQLRKYRLDLFKQILNESKDKAIEFFRTHIKDEYDMNSIINLLEIQKDKSQNNKEVLKLLNQIKLLQRQQIIKQQNYGIDKKPQSPKKFGFGLQKQSEQVNLNFKNIVIQQVNETHTQQEIEEDFNPFAKSNIKQQNIFDMNEKRKVSQSFGAQNIKKRN